MSIPDYQSLFLPLLEYTGDGKDHTLSEAEAGLAGALKVTGKERAELLPSGKQTVFFNRIGWAKTYLKKAGLLESPSRGLFRITDAGRAVLKSKPARMDNKFLEQFPEFIKFREISRAGRSTAAESEIETVSQRTPQELLELSLSAMREQLASDLLDKVMASGDDFFEWLVVKLLLAMGYGNKLKDAKEAVTGKAGDGGIDGIIPEDKLGLDAVYIQAKKWDGPVSRPEIQKFVGAMQGKKAKKGVFITTSTFASTIKEYINSIDVRVVLIDGKRLTDLMIDYNVGVSTETTYELKRIDNDFFSQDEV